MRAQDFHHRVVLDHRGGDRVRVNRIDPDAVLPQLKSECVCQRRKPVLGGRIMPIAGSGLQPACRTDDDDRTSVAGVDHRGDDRPQGAPGAGEVGVDHGVPLIVGEFPDPAPAQHTGIGHQHVEAAELLDTVGDKLPYGGVITDIDRPRQSLAAFGLHQPNGLGQILRRGGDVGNGVGDRCADIADDDVGTLTGQSNRIGATLAAGGPGDECDATIQSALRCCHQRSSRLPRIRLARADTQLGHGERAPNRIRKADRASW